MWTWKLLLSFESIWFSYDSENLKRSGFQKHASSPIRTRSEIWSGWHQCHPGCRRPLPQSASEGPSRGGCRGGTHRQLTLRILPGEPKAWLVAAIQSSSWKHDACFHICIYIQSDSFFHPGRVSQMFMWWITRLENECLARTWASLIQAGSGSTRHSPFVDFCCPGAGSVQSVLQAALQKCFFRFPLEVAPFGPGGPVKC